MTFSLVAVYLKKGYRLYVVSHLIIHAAIPTGTGGLKLERVALVQTVCV